MENCLKNAGKVMLLACLSLILFTGCNNQKSKLKLSIEAANKECPMSVGMTGEVTSITYDGTNVIYLLTVNEDYVNLESLEKTPEAMKAAAAAMFTNPQGDIRIMVELVAEVNSGIKLIYKGKASGKEVSCEMTTEDLKGFLNKDMTEEENDQQKLEKLVNVTNVSCPMPVGEGMTLDKLTVESENVVYYYTIDENYLEIASMKGNEAAMKQNVKNSLNMSDPALKLFVEVCLKCNKGIGYKYVGNTSGDSVEIVFSVPEVKAFF